MCDDCHTIKPNLLTLYTIHNCEEYGLRNFAEYPIYSAQLPYEFVLY